MVAVMLDNPFGVYIAWGNDYIQLYNDGYRPILGGTKHPQALGISTRDTFAVISGVYDWVQAILIKSCVDFTCFIYPGTIDLVIDKRIIVQHINAATYCDARSRWTSGTIVKANINRCGML
jgi:hypothetical protein